MTRRVVGSYLLIAAVVLATLAVPLGLVTANLERQQLVADLERDAVVVANRVEEDLENGATAVNPDLDTYIEETDARVLIVDLLGISVFDPANPDERRDYSTRPEIARALTGQRAVGERDSETLSARLLFVAVPVSSDDIVHGAVRLTYTTAELDAVVRSLWALLGGIALLSLAVTALVGRWIAGWVTRPTREVADAVTAYTQGDLDARAPTDTGPEEIRDLASRTNRMAARLSELLDSQKAFVAAASHQLRSPLSAVRLELEGVLATPPGERLDRAAVERALEETGRLGRVIDGLLALARADGTAAEEVDVEVADVVSARLELWRALAEEDGIVLTSAGGPPVRVRVVAGHLEQLLDNLVANALDACSAGESVTTSWSRDAGEVTISVSDTGPGLQDADLDRAFERFWSRTTADGGSGLGLPIARQLARACGGDVTLHHAGPGPGTGIRADITLPVATSAGTAVAPTTAPRRSAPPKPT